MDYFIVGLGNMGGSLAQGLLQSALPQGASLKVFDLHPDRMHAVAKDHQNVEKIEKIELACQTASCMILCIKPFDLKNLARKIAGKIHKDTILVSVLAGTPMQQVAEQLAFPGAVVRAMPNMAATIRQAATVLCDNGRCNQEQLQRAEAVFQSVGEAYWSKEDLMDAVTGLSGSGPAYIYMVIEALTDGGVKMGLPRDLARKLSTQTVLGAASLVKSTGLHPAILKDQVSTPAGTTISALHELEERGLRSMFVAAVVKATERSRHMRENPPY